MAHEPLDRRVDERPGDAGAKIHARTRARRMATTCDHDGVTEELLAGAGRFSTTFHLYDGPPVASLHEDERPRFGFYNEMKGIEVDDGRGAYAPDNNGITVVLVTDRRVLGLVGCEEGDHKVALHYDVITGVEVEDGQLHNWLVVESVEATYRLPINRMFDEEDLEAAAAFVRDRMVEPSRIIEFVTPEGTTWTVTEDVVASNGGRPTADVTGTGDAPESAPDPTVPHLADPDDDVEIDPDDAEPGDDDASDDASNLLTADDPLTQVAKLHYLKEAGVLTGEDYEQKKTELLKRV